MNIHERKELSHKLSLVTKAVSDSALLLTVIFCKSL